MTRGVSAQKAIEMESRMRDLDRDKIADSAYIVTWCIILTGLIYFWLWVVDMLGRCWS